jgi:hypothetical protein
MVRSWASALPYRAEAQLQTFIYMTIFTITYLINSTIFSTSLVKGSSGKRKQKRL